MELDFRKSATLMDFFEVINKSFTPPYFMSGLSKCASYMVKKMEHWFDKVKYFGAQTVTPVNILTAPSYVCTLDPLKWCKSHGVVFVIPSINLELFNWT